MRREELYRILDETDDVHIPFPVNEEDGAEKRIREKPWEESKLVSDAESLEGWAPVTYHVNAAVGTSYDEQENWKGLSTVTLSDEHAYEGSHSIAFSCPTNLEKLNDIAPGRIYAVPCAFVGVDREDWTKWNLLSAWVYPVATVKTITLRMQIHNDGEVKVPDKDNRIGAHNNTLKPNQWNHLVLEMPYLPRECVTGIGFEYDMVGHEPDADDHVQFFIDKVEVARVDCNVYQGWTPRKDTLIYSHSGYQPGATKIAFTSDPEIKRFKVLEMGSGRVVLDKEVAPCESRYGYFGICDFTEVADENEYLILAGTVLSRAFRIGADCWESSIWKTLNFFLAERCGFDVRGKHRACHSDMLLLHGSQSIVENGGWHDAADLAQSLPNTADGTCALIALARSLRGQGQDRLRARVLDEAKWGMDFVLKLRFGDGFRGNYSSSSIWTDGIIGSSDDITTEATNNAFVNFECAYTEAYGAPEFADTDPWYAEHCIKTAISDFDFAMERWEIADALEVRPYGRGGQPFANGEALDAQVASQGALAAAELYARTGEERFKKAAIRFGKRVIDCQQQAFTDWDVPMAGFYYMDRDKDLIWHHSHLSFSQLPDLAMSTLMQVFPDDENYMEWYGALALSGHYYKSIHRYTAPYGIIPAGVYNEDEPQFPDVKLQQWMRGDKDMIQYYKDQVHSGVPFGKGNYLRVFPVWFSYRGNYNVLLSEAVSMNAAAVARKDYELYDAAQDQFQFIIGKNPFGQSTMHGEGYDFVQLYAVQPGQSAGALSVGMESWQEVDEPYWPQVDTATYKEVWICSATKWIWAMADGYPEGMVFGVLKGAAGEKVRFTHSRTGKVYEAVPSAISGEYKIGLPSGEYTMCYGGASRKVTVVNNTCTRIDGPLYDLKACVEQEGGKATIRIAMTGTEAVELGFKAYNAAKVPETLRLEPRDGKAEASFDIELKDAGKAFLILATPNGNESDRLEIADTRLA